MQFVAGAGDWAMISLAYDQTGLWVPGSIRC
jgi:hypothetical protein